MIVVRVTPARQVTCRASCPLPVSAPAAWGQLRDFRRFAAQDFFHAAVRVDPAGVRAGASLEIDHRFGPLLTTRAGRILQWRENVGYSFSDLSPAGPRAAFPDIYQYRLSPAGPSSCVIHITVAGLWTIRCLPRWPITLWLRWVFTHIARSVHNRLLLTTAHLAPAEEIAPRPLPARAT